MMKMTKINILNLNNTDWTYNLRHSTSIKEDKQGNTKKYKNYNSYFPNILSNIIEAENYIYLYEHFEKICITAIEPPNTYTYKKIRLNSINKTLRSDNNARKKITIPKKFWDIHDNDLIHIQLHMQKDYLFPEYPLITIELIEN